MEALEAIMTRASPLKLVDPAPGPEVVEAACRAALRAPDHGKLRPWRLMIIEGEARRRLGEAMAASLKERVPETPPEALLREAEKPLRAPLIIVVAAVAHGTAKIPRIEQVMAGACAAQNLILALHAAGFGSLWKTGAAAYDDGVKRKLGLAPEDQIVGFIYTGTIGVKAPDLRRPEPADYVVRWTGPAD